MKRRSFLKSTLVALTLLYRGPVSRPEVVEEEDMVEGWEMHYGDKLLHIEFFDRDGELIGKVRYS